MIAIMAGDGNAPRGAAALLDIKDALARITGP
jgi:hypothetical protein